MWTIFSFAKLVGILQPNSNVSYVLFYFDPLGLCRRASPVAGVLVEVRLHVEPRPQILGNMDTGLTVTLNLDHFKISTRIQRYPITPSIIRADANMVIQKESANGSGWGSGALFSKLDCVLDSLVLFGLP